MKSLKWGLTVNAALCALVLVALSGCTAEHAATRPEPSAAPVAVAEPAEALEILLRMAGFLARAPRFSVNIEGSYDALQESGQKIEFGQTRKVTVSRPNRLRIEAENSDGEKRLVLYDGKDITAFSPSRNIYAQTPKPGDIDDAVTYFLKDLHMQLPLAALLLSRFPEDIQRRTLSLDYVERTEIDGRPAHHLAGRTETVDYQFWILEGAQPLPLRAVLTYENAEGQPQYRARFSDWNLAPEIQDSQFAFTPPEGARRIAFRAQLPQIGLQGATTPRQTGRQK
jgi:hypothetical protein